MKDAYQLIGTYWKHKNGNVYQIKDFANQHSTKEQYPLTVIYVNVGNETQWCRPLADWEQSFTQVYKKGKV